MSRPIPIGLHHTVCGSEALNLAKRLNEELATQQAAQGGSLGNAQQAHCGPDTDEPRSRSFEQGEKSKGMHSISHFQLIVLIKFHFNNIFLI